MSMLIYPQKAIIIYRSHEAGDYQLQESQTMPASKLNNPAAERDGTHSIAQPLSGIISSPQGFGHHYNPQG
ncbi:hypothetical protein CEP54_011300 [Fusarium duplospermum]|uniref:Uncharacterized protein n=1 Tax=Fusarium duplospermum TaxID=1325734 RepID=A0A428PFA8_9HYPO|nr:hypothetical protein CEP54_011300 [Fusarium duplospermum]